MSFNSSEYGWADITLLLGGQDLTGIRAIKYTDKADKEPIYAKGRQPRTIGTGNLSYEGEIELLQSDYETLVAAAPGKSILRISVDAIINYGNPPDVMTKDKMFGIQFTEAAKDIKQGDKFMPIKLPFIALRLENQI